MHMRYSFSKDGDEYAYAQRYNIDASFKDLCQVCRAVRKMPVSKALTLLESVSRLEMPIEYRRYNKKIGLRRELGGKKGRYPEKAARIVKQLLINALGNAKAKQIDEETLVVEHIAANKQNVIPRLAPKGRRMRANYETARVEVVLKGKPRVIAEISPARKEGLQAAKEGAGEAPKPQSAAKEGEVPAQVEAKPAAADAAQKKKEAKAPAGGKERVLRRRKPS